MGRRIRTLKPEMLDDQVVGALPDRAWRLYVSLIMMADDYGNGRAHPDQLRGAAMWGNGATADDVGESLARLSRDSLITVYEVRGQTYAHLNGWDRHQRVDNKSKPLFPGPNQAVEPPSRESRESLASPSETLALEGKGREGKGECVAQGATPEPMELFAQQPAEPSAATTLATTCCETLRRLTGRKHDAESIATAELARKLAKKRVTPEQVRSVVEAKVAEWLNDPKMVVYLRPSTLLAPGKFFAYLDDLNAGPSATAPRWRPPEV